MRNISDEKIIKITFFFSLLAHCLFLGMPGFNLSKSQPKKPEEISVQIEIEKPPLLPKIDVMGEEKKIKEIMEKQEEPKPKPEQELKPEEIVMEEFPKEPIEEKVEIIDPAQEAMLRYQDMVKQKIESCRRYPNWAKKQGFEGAVYLTFILLANGQDKDIKIVQSSGFDILDKEAVSTVKRANPFPPIPKNLACSHLKMEVVVVFRVK